MWPFKKKEEVVGIKVQVSLDEMVATFEITSTKLMPDIYCNNSSKAKGIPLLEALMNLEWVKEVYIRPREIIVMRKNSHAVTWKEVAPTVAELIRLHPIEEIPQVQQEQEQKKESCCDHDHGEQNHGDEDHIIEEKVKVILKNEVNPSVASHGGRIDLKKVKERKVYISMEGGCQGCAMSSETLKQGVEKRLCDAIPEIEAVIDVTNHKEGSNPYYHN